MGAGHLYRPTTGALRVPYIYIYRAPTPKTPPILTLFFFIMFVDYSIWITILCWRFSLTMKFRVERWWRNCFLWFVCFLVIFLYLSYIFLFKNSQRSPTGLHGPWEPHGGAPVWSNPVCGPSSPIRFFFSKQRNRQEEEVHPRRKLYRLTFTHSRRELVHIKWDTSVQEEGRAKPKQRATETSKQRSHQYTAEIEHGTRQGNPVWSSLVQYGPVWSSPSSLVRSNGPRSRLQFGLVWSGLGGIQKIRSPISSGDWTVRNKYRPPYLDLGMICIFLAVYIWEWCISQRFCRWSVAQF